MKKTILTFLVLSLAIFTSCSNDDKPSDEGKNTGNNEKEIHLKQIIDDNFYFIGIGRNKYGVEPVRLTRTQKTDFEEWVKDYNKIIKSNKKASDGIAGSKNDGAYTIFMNENGIEVQQLINMGLVGAIQLDAFYKKIMKIRSKRDLKDKIKLVEEGVRYLVGNPETTASWNANAFGKNVFGKYLVNTKSNASFYESYSDIISSKDEAKFNENLKKLINTTNRVFALKIKQYLVTGYIEELKMKDNFMASVIREVSEGFGLLYALSYAKNIEGKPYFSKNKALDMINNTNLWTLKNTSNKANIQKEAENIIKLFGVN